MRERRKWKGKERKEQGRIGVFPKLPSEEMAVQFWLILDAGWQGGARGVCAMLLVGRGGIRSVWARLYDSW